MADSRTAHILVIEDEPDLADLVRLNLELAGYRVSTAPNGRDGTEAVRRGGVDLILLDVMMPIMDGWQVLDALMADAATSDIPVVMLTALSEERDFIQGHLQGAILYMTKPFEIKQLLKAVETGLVPLSGEERAERRDKTRGMLTRLAELDSGRDATGPRVRLSNLESIHPTPSVDEPSAQQSEAQLAKLTELQLHVLERFSDGAGARQIAVEMDVSRSNIYALRKRIAQKLATPPDELAERGRQLLRARGN